MHYSRLELYRYIKHILPKDQRAEIKAHIKNCPECLDLLNQIKKEDKEINHPNIMIYPFQEHEKPGNRNYKQRRKRTNPWLKFLPNIIIALSLLISMGIFLSVFFKHR